MSATSWVNGAPADSVFLTDRGLAYGDGLFETLRWNGASFPLLGFHKNRLLHDSARLGIPLQEQDVDSCLAHLGRQLGRDTAVVKIIVTRGSGGRGYGTQNLSPPTVIAQVFPFQPRPRLDYDQGLALRLCTLRLAHQPILAGIKHLNRLEQVMARREWQDENLAEGLLLDQRGQVIECCSHNILWRRQQTLYTPALDQCGVNGVMRRWILNWAEQQGQAFAIERFSLSHLSQADEVFICNSVAGIIPVVSIRGVQRYQVGFLTRALQGAVESLFSE